tara:strand:+ start:1408 stop:1791 length:384 start_codon:yes stop_codon:yes gene_type:complete
MSTKLNESQKIACNLLATGMKTSEILKHIKIRPETLSRWKQNDLFQNELKNAQDDIISQIRETQKYILLKAQDSIIEVFENKDLDIFKKAIIAIRYLCITKSKASLEDEFNKQIKEKELDNKYGFKL